VQEVKMAVLVTGGTGFTGANIVRELAERGNEVVSLDIVPPDDMVQRYLAPWAKQVTWLTGDIVSGADLEAVSAYERVESIVHAATYTPYGDTEKRNGRRVCDINLEGTLNVLDLARRLEVKRFMYISSAAVYQGQATPGEPLKEDMPLRLEGYPLSPYGFYATTKLASELLTQRYAYLYGFEAASIRMSQNWGPVERVSPYHTRVSLPNEWTGKAVRGEPVEASPFGKGITEGRSFGVDHIYIKDTATAVAMMLEAPALSYPTYNISTGRALSLHEMVEAIRQASPGVTFVEPVPGDDPTRERQTYLDVTRLREDLGFVPRYDLVSALEDFIDWRRAFGFMD
jgi:nucleoside-diphosphate-sugar epimerase